MSRFEKVIVVIVLIIGLGGGVALIAFGFPPVISSIFISMAISVLVYHFMGGIKDTSFKMGPVKMGGSIAALIGCAFVINHYLEPQVKPGVGELKLTNNYSVVDSSNRIIGKLPLNIYPVGLTNTRHVLLNNSIELGKLDDSIIQKLNYYDEVVLNDYIEVFYNLTMSPFNAELVFDNNSEISIDYKNDYNKLPFKVIPVYEDGSDKTLISFRDDVKNNFYHILKRGTSIVISRFLKSRSKIYIVRVRQLDRVVPDCFVQYQIISLNYTKHSL